MALTLSPEQEALVERSVRAGRFDTPEEALRAAIDTLSETPRITSELTNRLRQVRSKTLVELFRDSPFAGLDIEFPRDRSPMRDIEFE